MTAGGSGDRRALLVGFAVTNQAVAVAELGRGGTVAVVDDHPTPAARSAAAGLGLDVIGPTGPGELDAMVAAADVIYPSPGVPDHHPVFARARRHGVPVRSEFDLARELDARPVVAVTGTDGKTTVITWVDAMLTASGVRSVVAGNVEVPLVTAIQDPTPQVFVVEASSFRLAHTDRFEPAVATWLNFGPDHLDAHATVEDYEAAKARIWRDQPADAIAIGNADDPVVAGHLARAPARPVTFGLEAGDYRVAAGRLIGPAGEDLAGVDELWRAFPHDVANALAASATARAGGATTAGVRTALRSFAGLPHRVTLIGEADGVRFFDDSKATAPHATLAALRGFDSVVLIAGGRNKGLDLGVLASGADRVRAVVAIGEAAGEIDRAFAGVRPVVVAGSMNDAVDRARALARPGDAVLLSPGCASFDRYGSYAERGDDFTRAVHDLIGART
ncbi:MAG: UDP-N-acetylmuramoyl-L-alanine--D-glutamate ligase [Acidimicrobiales bacterium]